MSFNPRDLPEERLTSLDEQGRRLFLYPASVSGVWKKRRSLVYGFLIFIFLILPWTTFQGEQTLLLDITRRYFVFFGWSFSAQDGPFIFFPLIIAVVGIAFLTSLWGRAWCGWSCPQTVFLDAIFRPIEKWVEGNHVKRMKLDREPMSLRKFGLKGIKWGLFFLASSHIAHSFTAYFVGAKNLFWITLAEPTPHWGLFIFVQVLTLILLFDFGWFREQFCIIMCPYGRFQSVLMGSESKAVLYDEERGEPRKQKGVEDHGDCIDCFKCVSVCPTGIDIRKGLQMECIACTACIDACDEVMEKTGRPKGLIRYSSLAELSGQFRSSFPVRSRFYFAVLMILATSFLYLLNERPNLDVTLIRAIATPYSVSGDLVINHFRLKLVNQSERTMSLDHIHLNQGDIVAPEIPLKLKAGESRTIHFFVKMKLLDFRSMGTQSLSLSLKTSKNGALEEIESIPLKLLGPGDLKGTKTGDLSEGG